MEQETVFYQDHFLEQFQFKRKWEGTEIFHKPLTPIQTWPPPFSTSPTRVVHFDT